MTLQTGQKELALQTIAMPKDANANGDIFGGWLVSQMDLACGVTARKIAQGRVVTVSIDTMTFLVPVKIGAIISCYTIIEKIGHSSMKMKIEVCSLFPEKEKSTEVKVTEGTFTFVAIDNNGKSRPIMH